MIPDRREFERREATQHFGRVLLTSLTIFLLISIPLHFALPRGSHAFTIFGFGMSGSAGAAIGWRRLPGWELARRLAFVQLTIALFAIGMAWLGGI